MLQQSVYIDTHFCCLLKDPPCSSSVLIALSPHTVLIHGAGFPKATNCMHLYVWLSPMAEEV